MVRYKGKRRLVHRVIAHIIYGIDLDDSSIDVKHSCDNPPCFNPEHLSPGTRKQNMQEASEKGRLKRVPKRFCKFGHELTEENTYIDPSFKRRHCRLCRKGRSADFNDVKKKFGF